MWIECVEIHLSIVRMVLETHLFIYFYFSLVPAIFIYLPGSLCDKIAKNISSIVPEIPMCLKVMYAMQGLHHNFDGGGGTGSVP